MNKKDRKARRKALRKTAKAAKRDFKRGNFARGSESLDKAIKLRGTMT